MLASQPRSWMAVLPSAPQASALGRAWQGRKALQLFGAEPVLEPVVELVFGGGAFAAAGDLGQIAPGVRRYLVGRRTAELCEHCSLDRTAAARQRCQRRRASLLLEPMP